jgi:hypothetical protein
LVQIFAREALCADRRKKVGVRRSFEREARLPDGGTVDRTTENRQAVTPPSAQNQALRRCARSFRTATATTPVTAKVSAAAAVFSAIAVRSAVAGEPSVT